jgi:hypothetical protein
LLIFRELRQGTIEFAKGSLKTNLKRTDIDRIEAGRAASANPSYRFRDLRGCSAVVHVVFNESALDPVIRVELPNPPQ